MRQRHSTMRNPTDFGSHKPYGSTTYRQIPHLLSRREPFEGHSMRAEWETHTVSGEPFRTHDAYVVYSYDQVIAIFDPVCWGPPPHVVIDPYDLYGHSHATSRHINLARAWLR